MTHKKELPAIGSSVKVLLPGERPWVTVLSHTKNGFIGKIDNRLFSEMSDFEHAMFFNGHKDKFIDGVKLSKRLPTLHRFKQGDEVEFVSVNGYPEWGIKE